MENELDKSGLLDAILTSAADYAIIVISRDGRIGTWNAGAEQVFGYSCHEIIGQPLDTLFTEEDRANGIPQNELDCARRDGRAMDYRWHRRKDGSHFWADGVMTPMYAQDGSLAGYVKILRDASEKREQEQEIMRLARVDPLTGLANRAEFEARFVDMTAAALRHEQLLILQLIDLDRFKEVNDRFGHQTGDGLLRQAAQRILHAVRDTDFVARMGGDEFVVLQPDAGSPAVGSTVADKLIQALARPFQVDSTQVRIGASIGISVYPRDATKPDELLRKADRALYKAKADARTRYHYFSKDLDEQALKRSRDLAGLRRALADHAFSAHYQPKIAATTGEVAAVEALLRCNEPVLADYPIQEVIGLAMEAGVMEEIGVSLMSEALRQLRDWHDDGMPQLRLCVNLCAIEMADAQLPQIIAGILARHGIHPACLDVELNEREIFDSGAQGLAILTALRETGVRVSIDDFGTGYSSLSYLNDLPVDTIKLDKSFLRDVPEDPQSSAVAAAIIDLAHGLNLSVVAEGVETAEQARFVLREQCDLLQGFWFSAPLPADEMTTWMRQRGHANLLPPPDAGRASTHRPHY